MKCSPLKRTTPLKKKKGFKSIRHDFLDDLFSEFIRKQAIVRVGGCEYCLRPKYDILKENVDILPDWKQLQCAHFDGRSNKAVRWDIQNAAGMCPPCHASFDAHPFEKIEWVKQHLGEDEFNMLQSRLRNIYPKPDKKAIELYLKTKIKELETIDGNKPIGD